MGGLNAYHFRMLCECPMNGGGGYTPQQVGDMTLDQIWFRVCDAEVLKMKSGGVTNLSSKATTKTLKPGKDGLFKGRDKDGNVIRARLGGKSLNRILMEKAEEERKAKLKKEKRKKRRKK